MKRRRTCKGEEAMKRCARKRHEYVRALWQGQCAWQVVRALTKEQMELPAVPCFLFSSVAFPPPRFRKALSVVLWPPAFPARSRLCLVIFTTSNSCSTIGRVRIGGTMSQSRPPALFTHQVKQLKDGQSHGRTRPALLFLQSTSGLLPLPPPFCPTISAQHRPQAPRRPGLFHQQRPHPPAKTAGTVIKPSTLPHEANMREREQPKAKHARRSRATPKNGKESKSTRDEFGIPSFVSCLRRVSSCCCCELALMCVLVGNVPSYYISLMLMNDKTDQAFCCCSLLSLQRARPPSAPCQPLKGTDRCIHTQGRREDGGSYANWALRNAHRYREGGKGARRPRRSGGRALPSCHQPPRLSRPLPPWGRYLFFLLLPWGMGLRRYFPGCLPYIQQHAVFSPGFRLISFMRCVSRFADQPKQFILLISDKDEKKGKRHMPYHTLLSYSPFSAAAPAYPPPTPHPRQTPSARRRPRLWTAATAAAAAAAAPARPHCCWRSPPRPHGAWRVAPPPP